MRLNLLFKHFPWHFLSSVETKEGQEDKINAESTEELKKNSTDDVKKIKFVSLSNTDQEINTSTTIGHISIKLPADVSSLQRMNPLDFNDPFLWCPLRTNCWHHHYNMSLQSSALCFSLIIQTHKHLSHLNLNSWTCNRNPAACFPPSLSGWVKVSLWDLFLKRPPKHC